MRTRIAHRAEARLRITPSQGLTTRPPAIHGDDYRPTRVERERLRLMGNAMIAAIEADNAAEAAAAAGGTLRVDPSPEPHASPAAASLPQPAMTSASELNLSLIAA